MLFIFVPKNWEVWVNKTSGIPKTQTSKNKNSFVTSNIQFIQEVERGALSV
jgi:hypothetical protein